MVEFDAPKPPPKPRHWKSIVLGMPGRIVLLALLLIVAYIGWSIATDTSPRESDRVVHPAGYSMVKPPDWETRIARTGAGQTASMLEFAPKQWKGLPPSMWVKQLTSAPAATQPASDIAPTQFEGQPAWVATTTTKRRMTRVLYTERSGTWYELGVQAADMESINLDHWWKFVKTFQAIGDR